MKKKIKKSGEIPSDKEMLDWLQKQTDKKVYGGLVIFRWSNFGRGWRLHETIKKGTTTSVRLAIANAMKEDK